MDILLEYPIRDTGEKRGDLIGFKPPSVGARSRDGLVHVFAPRDASSWYCCASRHVHRRLDPLGARIQICPVVLVPVVMWTESGMIAKDVFDMTSSNSAHFMRLSLLGSPLVFALS